MASSIPPMLEIMKDVGGVEMPEVFGKLGACPTCGYAGGGPNACAFDPERGPLGDWPPTIATFGAFTLKQWLTWHKDRSFGRIYDEWLAWLRRQEGVE